jgi:hypothetical protein
MKKNIKYNCKTCGVEVETRTIGEGFASWANLCVQCYSQSLMAKTAPEKPKEAPATPDYIKVTAGTALHAGQSGCSGCVILNKDQTLKVTDQIDNQIYVDYQGFCYYILKTKEAPAMFTQGEWIAKQVTGELGTMHYVDIPSYSGKIAVTQPDANLIASAPDMYEALKEAYDFVYEVLVSNKYGTAIDRLPAGKQGRLHNKIKIALAKADGKAVQS